MTKSANQLWKESGTTLSFKDWIQREKDKGVEIANKLLEDVVEPYKQQQETKIDTKVNDKFNLGVPKWAIYTGLSVLTFAVIYKFYNKKK